MTPRFILLIFASCIVMFAAIWAATAPKLPVAPAATGEAAAPALLYADCDAVRAANAAPLRASQPGYRPALDPNMNGIACEAVGAPDPMATLPAEAPTFEGGTGSSTVAGDAPIEAPPPTPPEPNAAPQRPEM